MTTPYVYRVLLVDVNTTYTNRCYELQGEKIVYASPTDGPDIQIRLNSTSNDAITLTPRRKITAPFTQFFVSVSTIGSGPVELFISSPASIDLEAQDVAIDEIASISNVERVSSGGGGQVSITTTSSTIVADNPGRKRVQVKNMGTSTVYVTADGGAAQVSDYPLDPGEVLALHHVTGAVSGITATGSSMVGYFEEG